VSRLVERMDDALYPGVSNEWYDEVFRDRIASLARPEMRVLDIGAGAGIVKEMGFRGKVAKVSGIDLDERVLVNPLLDDAKIASAEEIPYPDASFDLAFCDNVLEHLDRPEVVFREIARVLAPGGSFLAKTPNLYHYMPLVARATPHAFHQFYNRLRGRESVDTFPTRYRANTPAAIERLARGAGLRVESVELVEGRPEYLRLTPPTYLAGYVYERIVNSSPRFAPLRIVLIAHLRK
jgi:SAM-dependent methyltransferase